MRRWHAGHPAQLSSLVLQEPARIDNDVVRLLDFRTRRNPEVVVVMPQKVRFNTFLLIMQSFASFIGSCMKRLQEVYAHAIARSTGSWLIFVVQMICSLYNQGRFVQMHESSVTLADSMILGVR